ncbi:hypothetical protein MIR68_004253 [Amoeboaphelidium protococcarum]|nr:hypothetical protein MIR68_004253 [Amoeboaphelidium protococcarum]
MDSRFLSQNDQDWFADKVATPTSQQQSPLPKKIDGRVLPQTPQSGRESVASISRPIIHQQKTIPSASSTLSNSDASRLQSSSFMERSMLTQVNADADWIMIEQGQLNSSNSSGQHHVSGNGNRSQSDDVQAQVTKLNMQISKINKFKAVLNDGTSNSVDLEKLRKLSWSGVPDEFRMVVWQLLLGYMPVNNDRRQQVLDKRRAEYRDYVSQSFILSSPSDSQNNTQLQQQQDQVESKQSQQQQQQQQQQLTPSMQINHAIWHQIHIDVPRTNPSVKLYQNHRIQQSLERILFCWAIRHPSCGYVQGINDLATPFYSVYLSGHLEESKIDIDVFKDNQDFDSIPQRVIDLVEADTFWCLTKLLDGIQDNYMHSQPGIQRQIGKMKELINRIDSQLYSHLQSQGIEFIQFAFRWMNCLLMREMSIRNVIRMWDSYLSEGPDGFSDFHVYVASAFLAKWTDHLKSLEFQDIIMFLQSPPTKDWSDKEIEVLLSEAFMWKSLFHGSPNHLNRSSAQETSSWSI